MGMDIGGEEVFLFVCLCVAVSSCVVQRVSLNCWKDMEKGREVDLSLIFECFPF